MRQGATYEASTAYTYTISKTDITNGNGELIFKIELSSSTDTDVNITTYDLPIKISDEITFDDFGIGKLEWANGTTFSSSMNANVNINNFNNTETVTYKLYLWDTLQTAYTMTSNAKKTLTKTYTYIPTYYDRNNRLIEIPYYFTVTDSNGNTYVSETNFLKYEMSSSEAPAIEDFWVETEINGGASNSYTVGDEIEWDITVHNDSSRPLYDVVLECNPNSASGTVGHTWTIGTLDILEASPTYHFHYIVTEDDILYYAKIEDYPTLAFEATGYIDKEYSDSYSASSPGQIPVEDSNPHLTCDIIMASYEDALFNLDDEYCFNCSVINDGNLTITNITLSCEITGDEWPIASLAPGEKKIFPAADGIVTAADILAGEFILECYATGTSPDPNEPEVSINSGHVTPGEYPLPCVDPIINNIPMTMILSSPANGNNYVLGENVDIELTWTNNNNVDGAHIYCTEETDVLGIDEINLSSALNEPGLSYSMTSSYTITEDDLFARSISFVLSMQVTEDINNITEEWTESYTITNIEAPNPELSLSFETTGTWAEYEDISIIAIIQNTGNLTLNNYVLQSEVTGDTWRPEEALLPGSSKQFSAQAQLYPEDIEQGYKDVDWLAQAVSPLQNFTTVKYNTIQRVTSSSLQ